MSKPILLFREQAAENTVFSQKQSLQITPTRGLLHALVVTRMEMQFPCEVADLDGSAEQSSNLISRPCRQVFGPLSLDPLTNSVLAAGRPITLSIAEFNTISILIRHCNMPMTREAIAAALVQRGVFVGPHMIDICICRLRLKLGMADLGHMIVTAWGRGYLVGDLPSGNDEPLAPCRSRSAADLLPV